MAPHAVAAAPAPQPLVAASSTAVDVATWDPDLSAEVNQPAFRAPIPLVQPPPIPLVQPPPIPLVQAPVPVPVVEEPPPAPYVAPAVEPLPLARLAPVPDEPAPVAPLASPPPAPAAQPAPVSLAEAFATLLAAEHGQAAAPIPLRQSVAPAPDLVDDIARQVLDRLQQDDMRRVVLDVAERLVREEIDRIKRIHG